MVFVNKKKKDDLKELKKTIEGKPPEPPSIPEVPQEAPSAPELPPIEPRAAPKRSFPIPASQPAAPPTDAPLFVRIDRYAEVLNRLDSSKEEIKSLASLFDMLMQLEEMRKGVENTIKEHIAEITDLLISLDSEFVSPQQTEGFVPERKEVETEVQRYVGDLQRELRYLKDELDKI